MKNKQNATFQPSLCLSLNVVHMLFKNLFIDLAIFIPIVYRAHCEPFLIQIPFSNEGYTTGSRVSQLTSLNILDITFYIHRVYSRNTSFIWHGLYKVWKAFHRDAGPC